MTKLESCLCTLKEDPDQYFQNLNSKNREYIDWKKRNVKSENNEENKSFNEEEEEDHGTITTSTGVADNFGFFQTMLGFFHSSAISVLTWGGSRSSSSSHGHTAPGYYSSYSHTSRGSVSFPSLGGIFSYLPHYSSDQSSSLSVPVYETLNTSNTNTPSTSNTSSSTSGSSTTYTPQHYTGCCCADCVEKYAY